MAAQGSGQASAQPAPDAFELEQLAVSRERRDLLRFITCGSVDDGKSTLIGRLLYDSRQLFEDQLSALTAASAKAGGKGAGEAGGLDLALALDGLAAEREQGITIDVAYRFFSTDRRSFIVADTPGHEQYTRNMATGASTADAAVLLVDVRKGLSRQTRRHSLLVSTLGIRHVVLAVNKMDLVEWSQEAFAELDEAYRAFAADLGFASVRAIPMAAKLGDNVVRRSTAMPWYRGPDLLTHLEGLDVGAVDAARPFRLPVQWVNRPDQTFRGVAGLVGGGPVRPGDHVIVLPSGERTQVARIVTYDGDLDVAVPGSAVTLTLTDEVDAPRGAVIAAVAAPPRTTDRIEARLFWMGRQELRAGASYLAKIGTQTVTATIAAISARVDLATLRPQAAAGLAMNDVGDVVLQLDRVVCVDAFTQDRDLGTFILIDRESFDTIGMGLVSDDAGTGRSSGTERGRVLPWPGGGAQWLPSAFATRRRSALKTASWRVIGTLLTIAAAYLLTGDARVALLLGAFEAIVKSVVHFGHERVWTHLGFGLSAVAPRSSPLPNPVPRGRA